MRKSLYISILFALIISTFYGFPVYTAWAQEIGLRQITITVFLDAELFEEDRVMAEEQIREAVGFVSRIFEREFQLTFNVREFMEWEFPKRLKGVNALNAWHSLEYLVAATRSNIALGITRKKLFLNYNTDTDTTEKTYYRGFAPRLSRSAIVAFDSSLRYHILHEVGGHLFGADHSNEPDSIMSWNSIDTEKFDERSRRIIRSKRDRSFPYQ